MNNKQRQEKFLDKKDYTPMYGIYQIKDGSRLRSYRFLDYETLRVVGKKVKRDNYSFVYAESVPGGKINLEEIYTRFNLDPPADFTGYSLSVSDVVVMKYTDGNYAASYVDYAGFKTIPGFMAESGRSPRKQSGAEM